MPPTPAPQSPVPQHCPSPTELDDLELLLGGALRPATGFNEPGSALTLALPPDVESAATEAGAVELVDPEGLPLARAAWPSGAVEPLARPEHGPFRRLYLTPAEARERYAGRTFAALDHAPYEAQLAGLRTAGPVVLLALVGHGTPSLSPPALLRACLAAARELPDAAVVAAPLTARASSLRDRVLAAYAGSDPLVDETSRPGGEDAPAPVSKPAPTYSPTIAAIVAAAQKPPDERGLVLFFTGLSGSGKSTLARALMDRVLEQTARTVTSLDGDVVRRNLSAGLSFSKADRETNIRRIGWVAAEIARHGGLAVCSPIAPFDETRRQVRQMVEDAGGTFFLVHVATPLAECERRDRKGLYAKARRGEIPEFTGISSSYEEPQDAAVRVDTTGRSIDAALADVLAALTDADLLHLGHNTTGTPFRILFVCTANICRSPYLEAAARHHLGPGTRVEVRSAGTHGFDAAPADETMAAELTTRGIDSADFRSRRVTRELIDEADVVLTAESSHRSFLLQEHPAAFRKVFTLGQLARYVQTSGSTASGAELVAEAAAARGPASPDLDVADPYRRGDAAARAAAQHLDDLLAVVLPALTPKD